MAYRIHAACAALALALTASGAQTKTIPSAEQPPVRAWTAREPGFTPAREFSPGETVVLRGENRSPFTLYLYVSPAAREIYRGEDVVVRYQRGDRWVNAAVRAYIDESPIRCVELRPGMNFTRAWTSPSAPPGTYRMEFTYTTSPAQCEMDLRVRTGAVTVHSEPFTVRPLAAVPATPPSVTGATAIATVGAARSCPVTVTFTGTIQATGPGRVSYVWERSDGGTQTTPSTVEFTAAGSRTVTKTWTLGEPGREVSGWQRLRVISPGEMRSEPAAFRFTCGA